MIAGADILPTVGPNAYLSDALLDIRSTFRDVVKVWLANDAGDRANRANASMEVIAGLVSLEEQIANALADLEDACISDKDILARIPGWGEPVDPPRSDVHAAEATDPDALVLAKKARAQ